MENNNLATKKDNKYLARRFTAGFPALTTEFTEDTEKRNDY